MSAVPLPEDTSGATVDTWKKMVNFSRLGTEKKKRIEEAVQAIRFWGYCEPGAPSGTDSSGLPFPGVPPGTNSSGMPFAGSADTPPGMPFPGFPGARGRPFPRLSRRGRPFHRLSRRAWPALPKRPSEKAPLKYITLVSKLRCSVIIIDFSRTRSILYKKREALAPLQSSFEFSDNFLVLMKYVVRGVRSEMLQRFCRQGSLRRGVHVPAGS